MKVSKTTPMIRQYLSIKEKYADAILLYRMGDFYEMFFEDAEIASRILDITLTSRNKKEENPIPMCGVPHKAVQGYIARLIEHGKRVAICDQTEDPAASKGLVKRDVVRVITPGMIVENELLDEKSNNFVVSLFYLKNLFGLSCLDISTGTFRLAESEDAEAILDEAFRIAPSEVIVPSAAKDDACYRNIIEALSEKSITYLDNTAFDYKEARERLIEQFRTLSLAGFGCEEQAAGVSAAGALLYYVRETQKQTIEHISGIEAYSLGSYLIIDEISCRNLELLENIRTGTKKGTLLDVLDKSITAMGGRLFRNWMRYPLLDTGEISRRQDAVEEATKSIHVVRQVRENLKSVADLERLGTRISMGHSNARDLLALKRSINMLPVILTDLAAFQALSFQYTDDPSSLYKVAGLIEKAIREDAPPVISEGGMIKKGYHAELDELISISSDGKGWLAQLETREREKTGINSLKVRYNKVFAYYIEIPKTHTKSVPPHYVRKQTLVNAERYITDELKSFESKVLGAEEKRTALEYRLFNEIRSEVVKVNARIRQAAAFLAKTDVLLAMADVAERNDYCRPVVCEGDTIQIEDGRHPVVEKMITGERFVPNTIRLDNSTDQVLIITGPNMAGKSTILRQVALMVIMAQMGGFVPAGKAEICITDRIFTRVGALDNLSSGQSTFMVEMQETANILNSATDRSLVIMDEIGRGTSTFDGLSIAWAVAEYLHDLKNKGVKTLFATHYHELTELAKEKPRVKNFNIAVKEWNDEIIFLRKLVEGGTNRSYGIQVARLAGIPEQVIKRSKKILFNIENGKISAGVALPGGIQRPPGQEQLSLFQRPEGLMMGKLRKLDISKITPLEALNFLSALQEESKYEPGQ